MSNQPVIILLSLRTEVLKVNRMPDLPTTSMVRTMRSFMAYSKNSKTSTQPFDSLVIVAKDSTRTGLVWGSEDPTIPP